MRQADAFQAAQASNCRALDEGHLPEGHLLEDHLLEDHLLEGNGLSTFLLREAILLWEGGARPTRSFIL